MSDAQKPVEETPAVVPAAEPVVEAPKEEETPAVEETTATPEVAETTEAAKEEVKPATEGTLGYKAPGLVK